MNIDDLKNSLREMVTPVTYPASLIVGFTVINIEHSEINNPFYKEGETTEPRYIRSVDLVQKMIDAGWELSRAGTVRKDECSFGSDSSVAIKERFVLVFIKKRV